MEEPLDIYPLSQILMADMQAGKLALPFKWLWFVSATQTT
jgi:hypothetical protein